ncbi:MAG TPA: hypothetical protein VNC82_03570 [Candidatus Limnocylindria bacterium]|nr:hypothetical protein [Candidatus Limnocylindria bacterium]
MAFTAAPSAGVVPPRISHQDVRSKKREEAMRLVDGASRRHERPTVLQDPVQSFAAVVVIFNDQDMHPIEAAEVFVHEPRVRQWAYRLEERGWELGRRRCGCQWPGAVGDYR